MSGGGEGNNVLGTLAVGIEDLDGKEGRLLGYAVGFSTDGACNVGAVAVAVGVLAVSGKVLQELGAATKVLQVVRNLEYSNCVTGGRKAYSVVGVDASVNDICAGASTSRVIVGISRATGFFVGDASETPGSVFLGSGDGDDGVLFNKLDLFGKMSACGL